MTRSAWFVIVCLIACGSDEGGDGAAGPSSVSSSTSASSTGAGLAGGSDGGGGAVGGSAAGGGDGGRAPPPCMVSEAGTGVLAGTVTRAADISGNPGCMSSSSAAVRLQVAIFDAASSCTSHSECAIPYCWFGRCVAMGLATVPYDPDFEDPAASASYCSANTDVYLQLPPGDYELFAYYDCDGDDAISAGDLVSSHMPLLEATVVADQVVEAGIVLDQECTGACVDGVLP